MTLSEQIQTRRDATLARAEEDAVEALCLYVDCIRRNDNPEQQDLRRVTWAIGVLGGSEDRFIVDAAAYVRAQRRHTKDTRSTQGDTNAAKRGTGDLTNGNDK